MIRRSATGAARSSASSGTSNVRISSSSSAKPFASFSSIASSSYAGLTSPPFMRKFQRVSNLPASPSRWTLVQYGTGPMSALGHKRTYAVQNVMSALHPIATTKAKFRKRPCLLYPQKRTCAVHRLMSAFGQKRTSGPRVSRTVCRRLSRSCAPRRLQIPCPLQ